MKQKKRVALLRVCVFGLAAGFIGADRVPAERGQPRDYAAVSPAAPKESPKRKASAIAVAGLSSSSQAAPSMLDDASALDAPSALPIVVASLDGAALSAAAAAGSGAGTEQDDYYSGLRAYQAGDRAQAIAIWRRAALEGNDLLSQNRLGTLYKQGRFVLQNHAESYTWHTLAVINTNLLTDQDSDGFKDQTQAKASSDKERVALRSSMTEDELALSRRTVVALYERKGPQGLLELAELFANGKGLEKNEVEAYRYYVLASFFGDKKAITARDALALTLQPAQIAAAQRAAATWKGAEGAAIVPEYAKVLEPPVAKPEQVAEPKPLTAEVPPLAPPAPESPAKPEPAAPASVKDGTGPAKDQSAATKPETAPAPPPGSADESQAKLKAEVQRLAAMTVVALDKSSDDTASAQQALRVLGHFRGRPDGKFGGRTTRAIMAFQRNAGWRRTGSLTQEQFLSLLVQAARRDDAVSQLNLGLLYAKGRYAALDGTKALEQLKQAAQQGLGEAHFQIGLIYRDGVGGVARDTGLAAFHLREARKRKHPKAEQALRGLES